MTTDNAAVPDEDEDPASRQSRKRRLAVAVYRHGYPAREVGVLLEVSTPTATKFVAEAGATRSRTEARATRGGLLDQTTIDRIARLIDQVVQLATEMKLPAELLAGVLVERVTTVPTAEQATRPTCDGVCGFNCTAQCAIRVPIGDRAKAPGSPPTSAAHQGRREGVSHARTRLTLPESETRSQRDKLG